jgi:hypothetical protein
MVVEDDNSHGRCEPSIKTRSRSQTVDSSSLSNKSDEVDSGSEDEDCSALEVWMHNRCDATASV